MKIDLEHYGPGRPPLPETMDRMKRMVREIQKEPGIMSAKLARKLGISSLECAALARRLERRKILKIERADRALTYFVTDDLAA
ncbi:MAG TPA: winged helix-turn-helix transcriptional regulator [Sphingomicrobium sp.]|jgi:DNA-binding Lrp family transcriptional regulator|nr:winged helix-turn-helix transcriptional regulator [Sphingomicrobium sp.]